MPGDILWGDCYVIAVANVIAMVAVPITDFEEERE